MARIEGPNHLDIKRRGDAIEEDTLSAIRSTLKTVANSLHGAVSVDDLATITREWNAHVENIVDDVAADFSEGVVITHRDTQRAVSGLTAAANDQPDAGPVIPKIHNRYAEQLLKNARNRLRNVGNDVWHVAREQLVESVNLGEGVDKLRDRIIQSAHLSAPRAAVVARSESSYAMNQGSLQQMRLLDLPTATQEWIATDDGRTRPEHLEMDGAKVALDQPFQCADGTSEPGEAPNCRCCLGYDIPDDSLSDALVAAATRLPVTVATSGGAMTDLAEPIVTETPAEDLGGKPSSGTPADKRLKSNKRKTASTPNSDGATADLAGYEPEPYEPDTDETVQCPQCELMNAPDARYCDQCGFMLIGNSDVEGAVAGVVTLAAVPDVTDDLGGAVDPSMSPVMSEIPTWRGCLVVEGDATGDGREFAIDALDWAVPPLPLRWQAEDSHGGMPTNKTVNVGTIQRVWRETGDDGTNRIMGEGVFDLGGPDDDYAHEAARRVGNGSLSGISIDADDITDADIEYVFDDPDEEEDEEDNLFKLLFAAPSRIIFHSARIRAATLCDIPAFVQAKIGMIPEDERAAIAAAGGTRLDAVSYVQMHQTETSDEGWDPSTHESRLPDQFSRAVASDSYAWVDIASGDDDADVSKLNCKFLHHEITEDGTVGAANLTACASGIGMLLGSRGGVSISAADRHGVYDHLAAHLRDAGQTPQQYETERDAIVASSWRDELWKPPAAWFADPKLGQVTPIMITDSGRVYGHAAQWGQCHVGYLDECVMPPFEEQHDHYMTGELPLDDGTIAAVGQITAGIEHAPLHLSAAAAKDHYENTDAVVCDVVIGNDSHGIWVAGAIRASANPDRIQCLQASGQVSPDWRVIGGKLRMVALLTVNASGYQTPKSRSFVAGGRIRSLVASGMVTVKLPAPNEPSEEDLNLRALRLLRDHLTRQVHPEGGE